MPNTEIGDPGDNQIIRMEPIKGGVRIMVGSRDRGGWKGSYIDLPLKKAEMAHGFLGKIIKKMKAL